MTARVIRAILMVFLFSFPAHAHTLSVSHLDIATDQQGKNLTVELDLSLRDLALTIPLDRNHDEEVTWGELKTSEADLSALVRSFVQVTRGENKCALRLTDLGVRQYDDGVYAALTFRAECPTAGLLRVHYALFFAQDPQHRALISYHSGGSVETGIARADARRIEFGVGKDSPLLQFLREGMHHILIGYDHLAFLLSLLLTATLVRSGNRWEPAPNLRESLVRVCWLVTAFTLAHSITLSLAALNLVTPASKLVEPAIAGSVLVAALNNLRPVVTQRTWAIAFVFGLVHGFGFAGALSEIGLPKNAALASIIGFNLGVEVGQLTVVLVTLPVLYFVRNRLWYPRLAMPLASALIAVLALGWMLQRLLR